jgi:hypothetical protein
MPADQGVASAVDFSAYPAGPGSPLALIASSDGQHDIADRLLIADRSFLQH